MSGAGPGGGDGAAAAGAGPDGTALVVSVDCRAVALPGIGRFVTELWPALRRAAAGGDVTPVALTPARPPRGWLGREAYAAPAGGTRLRARAFGLGEQVELPVVLRRLGVGVHHAPHLSVPRLGSVPVVLTVHDLFPLEHPAHARSPAARWYYRTVLPAAVRRAAAVVAVSPSTAAALRDRLGVDARVIRHGVDPQRWRPAADGDADRVLAGLGVRRPYLLYVGTAKPHKNLATVLAALDPDLPPLVLAGPTAGELARARRGAAGSAAGSAAGAAGSGGPAVAAHGGATPLGRVPDRVLPALYSAAAAVVVPSLYEAVGLTTLEAMACGAPVVASGAAAAAAEVGDAVVAVPATDPEAWRAALHRVVGDDRLRAVLRRRGPEVAGGRSWDAAAHAYLGVYREVAGR